MLLISLTLLVDFSRTKAQVPIKPIHQIIAENCAILVTPMQFKRGTKYLLISNEYRKILWTFNIEELLSATQSLLGAMRYKATLVFCVTLLFAQSCVGLLLPTLFTLLFSNLYLSLLSS